MVRGMVLGWKVALLSSRAQRGILPGNGSNAATKIPRCARDDSGCARAQSPLRPRPLPSPS